MILVTIDIVPGRQIESVLGIAKGTSVRAVTAADDLVAVLKNAVGGEIHEYTAVLAQTREQALDRMIADARRMGADAIVGVRFASADVSRNAAEFLAYGTAVRLAKA